MSALVAGDCSEGGAAALETTGPLIAPPGGIAWAGVRVLGKEAPAEVVCGPVWPGGNGVVAVRGCDETDWPAADEDKSGDRDLTKLVSAAVRTSLRSGDFGLKNGPPVWGRYSDSTLARHFDGQILDPRSLNWLRIEAH